MVIDFTFNGQTVQAIQVGRFVVCVCCGEDKHVVIHGPTKQPLMCGLTQRVAVMVADTMSLYTRDSRDVRCLPAAMREWANHLMRRPKRPKSYREFYKHWTGKNVRLPVLTKATNAAFAEAIGRR